MPGNGSRGGGCSLGQASVEQEKSGQDISKIAFGFYGGEQEPSVGVPQGGRASEFAVHHRRPRAVANSAA